MKALERAIRLHWAIHFPGRKWKKKQTGDYHSDNQHIRGGGYGVINMDGHDIHYFEEASGSSFVVYGGNTVHENPCFVLLLDGSDNTATLQSLYKYENCFDDGHQDGRAIVKAAYRLAQEHGARQLFLTDYSYIKCPQKIFLADLSFLTTGQTWYESILPGLVCKDCEDLETLRTAVRTTTWRTVGADLIDIDLPGIDIDAPGSAMIVLNAMKKDGGFCWFFKKYMNTLLVRSGGESLRGYDWVCEIHPLVSRLRQTLKSSSRRGGGPSKRRK